MIRRIFKKNKLREKNFFVEPDEIFLDSKNLQNFDRQQFEWLFFQRNQLRNNAVDVQTAANASR